MCALYVNTSREREGGGSAPEEANIRELVEKCAHNDDITPLVRLMFEAQAVPDSPQSIDGAGQAYSGDVASCGSCVQCCSLLCDCNSAHSAAALQLC
jgi:hypothetical protein